MAGMRRGRPQMARKGQGRRSVSGRRGVEGQLASLCSLWAANRWARHTPRRPGSAPDRRLWVPKLTVVGAGVSNAETLPDAIGTLGAFLVDGFFGFFGRQQRGRPRVRTLISICLTLKHPSHVSAQALKRLPTNVLTATAFTSQSKCQVSPPIQVALVRLTVNHTSHLLIVTLRRRGKSQDRHYPLLWYDRLDFKQYARLTVLQSRLERLKSRYGSTTTKWRQLKTISEGMSGATWQIPYSFLYV